MGDLIDLGEVRAERSIKRLIEKRAKKAELPDGWRVDFTADGRVVLHFDVPFDGEMWEITLPLEHEVARKFDDALGRAISHASTWRDAYDGIVSLYWCSPSGRVVHGRSVEGRITGRVPGGLVVEPMPSFPYRASFGSNPHGPEPKHGWPPAGIYETSTGAYRERLPRRRHWRVAERNLEMLRYLEEKGIRR